MRQSKNGRHRNSNSQADRLCEADQDMVNIQITPLKSSDKIQKSKIQSSATRVSDMSKDTKSDSDHGGVASTETMLKRW